MLSVKWYTHIPSGSFSLLEICSIPRKTSTLRLFFKKAESARYIILFSCSQSCPYRLQLAGRALTRAKDGPLPRARTPPAKRYEQLWEGEWLTSGSESLRASTFSRIDSSQSVSDGVWRKIRVTSPQHSLSFSPGWLRRYGWLKRNSNETSLLQAYWSAVSYMTKKQAEFWGKRTFCKHIAINPLTPETFCQKCVFWTFWWFWVWISAKLALIWSKMNLQHGS